MEKMVQKQRKAMVAFQGFFMYTWLANLEKTDAYFSVYLLCALAGVVSLCGNYREKPQLSRKEWVWSGVFGGLFSLATVLANYALFEPITALLSLFNAGCALLGGWAIGWNVLVFWGGKLPKMPKPQPRRHPKRVFWGVFASVAVIDLAYLCCASYPGVLTTDAISTMKQVMGLGEYNNTMPFWHTVTVELFVKLGLAVFGDINRAVAVFHGAQILFLAACFGYAIMTLYQIGVPGGVLAAVYGIYALLPYNIVYSVTMWKDVPFGAAALLMVTALYRILQRVGKSQKGNFAVFTLGAMGFSLWRTNGWYAFLVVTVLMLVLLRREYKKVLVLMCAVLVLCWVLINPLLSVLGVSGTDMTEALAIPFQQVARVVANGRELTQEEQELLSEAFWLDKMEALYDPNTVDPVKFETFRKDNLETLKENWGAYLKLYLQLGMRYPGDYLKAWIEETKGYWNGGYFFWIYTWGIDANDMGIVYTGGENGISRLFAAWFRYAEKADIFQPLYSIGLYAWLTIGCCLMNVLKKRREFLLTIPALVLLVGLWLGTPVYAEFRYAYPVILCLPMTLAVTVFEKQKEI